MKGIQSTDRGYLAIAETAGERLIAKRLGELGGVPVCRAKEIFPATETREEKRAIGPPLRKAGRLVAARQILDGGVGIPNLVLERLANTRDAGYDHSTGVGIRTDNAFHEKVTGIELMDVFRTRKTGKEVAPSVGFFIVAERLKGTLQSTVGRQGVWLEALEAARKLAERKR